VEAKSKPAGQLQDAQNEVTQKQREEGAPSAAPVDALRERDQKALAAKDEAKPSSMAETVRQAAAAPPAPAPAPPPARGDAATAEKRAEPLNMARPNEQAAGAFLKSALTAPVMLASGPGVAIRRLGNRLERSTDGGATWTTDLVPAPESLRAGACPTALVCWVGGTAGIVLVRGDSGVWSRRDLGDPAAVIGAIEAADATSATVTLADGRRFRTTDAGATWSLAPETTPR
jgi:hypothetical protein